ncbi:hypothetical protein ACFL6G_02250 [candidate division KSB1 bacterium]
MKKHFPLLQIPKFQEDIEKLLLKVKPGLQNRSIINMRKSKAPMKSMHFRHRLVIWLPCSSI